MPRRQKPPGKENWTWDEIEAGRRKSRTTRRPKRGEDFERAVFAFAKTLDASAQVFFDHRVKDVDTGEPRQCDVWISGEFGGHLPFSYLVSCKDHKRKMHVGDIGCFIDEVRSTNADMGVMYSRGGFNENALKKANRNRVSCCRLFSNEEFDIPTHVFFQMLHCTSMIGVKAIHIPRELNVLTWNDLLDVRVTLEEGTCSVGDVIARAFHLSEESSISKASGGFPPETAIGVECQGEESGALLRLQVHCRWRTFRAKADATLVSGSYCLRNNSFAGLLAGPAINMQSDHPGPGWEEIRDPSFDASRIKQLGMSYGPSASVVIDFLREQLGKELLLDSDQVTDNNPASPS